MASKENKYYLVVALIFGAFVYIIFGGARTLNIFNINFLMSGDPAQHWIGWETFRRSPILQWPLGRNDAYGMDIGNTVVFTDSIPLIAIPLKYILYFYHQNIQYTGLWLMLCFALISLTSYNFVQQKTNDKLYALLCTVFFTTSAVLIQRAIGHYALCAQWLLIYSITLQFSDSFSRKKWMSLILLSSLIHAYLMAMCLAIFFADLLNKTKRDRESIKSAAIYLIILFASLYVLMDAVGYFTIAIGSTYISGFGFFHHNLLGFINPNDQVLSTILPEMKKQPGDYEGQAYAGAGLILMAIITIFSQFSYLKEKITSKNRRIALALMVGLYLYSLSGNIAFGDRTIIDFNYPSFLHGITGAFRASGRFIWPVFYTLSLLIVVANYKYKDKRLSYIILALCLSIQAYDKTDSAKWSAAHYIIDENPLQSETKNQINIAGKDCLVAFKPEDFNEEWLKFSYYAAMKNMKIGFGYFARFDREKYDRQKDLVSEEVLSGDMRENCIYVFKNEADAISASNKSNGRFAISRLYNAWALYSK